jgi:hypothetical protein
VDDFLAQMWAPLLPQVRINEGAAVRSGGQLGWAIRKGSPKLMAEIADFYEKGVRRAHPVGARVALSTKRVRGLENSSSAAAQRRFAQTIELFRSYGTKYGFDPCCWPHRASRNPGSTRRPAATWAPSASCRSCRPRAARCGSGTSASRTNNIHAGAKYMDQLMERTSRARNSTRPNRTLFAFAAYNAGPGNMARMRKEAEKRGLDPDQWFNHVEVVPADRIGIETTTYVRNIYKYYVFVPPTGRGGSGHGQGASRDRKDRAVNAVEIHRASLEDAGDTAAHRDAGWMPMRRTRGAVASR